MTTWEDRQERALVEAACRNTREEETADRKLRGTIFLTVVLTLAMIGGVLAGWVPTVYLLWQIPAAIAFVWGLRYLTGGK